MTLSDLSIRRPVFAWMLMAALIVFGGFALMNMGISEMPDADFPVVSVHIGYEGASPEVMEADVADAVEDAVMSVQGIKSVSSSSVQGSTNVTIEFEIDRNIDAALQEVQTKIAQAQKNLPPDVDPPVVTKSNPEDQPIMWVSLSGDKPLRDMMLFARDHLKDRLQTVEGVGEVILGGYVEPNIRIWMDPAKMAEYQITAVDIVNALNAQHAEIPGGVLETPLKEFSIRSMGEASSVEALKNLIIPQRGGAAIYKPVRLGEVAQVDAGLDDIRRISRTQGKSAIGLGVKKQRGANAVAIGDRIAARVAELNKTLPEGYHLLINFDSTQFIRHTVAEMKFNLILSALLTAIACLLFLASWGSTVNVLFSIPTSIIGSFLFLYFFGFTLNTFTLLGLILAIGIVVDDAIMVLENIVRHLESGKTRLQAALLGAREITPAAVATTLAIMAIFIPTLFMKGIMGKFFFQFGATMTVAVGLSLLEAVTLTPMRASRFLSEEKNAFSLKVQSVFERLKRGYTRLLTTCLNHRWAVIGGAVAVFILSALTLPGLKKEFVPAQDQSSFLVRAQTPLGSSIEFTNGKMKEAEAILMKHPEVLRIYTAVGGFGGGDVNTGMVFVTLRQLQDRPKDKEAGHRLSQIEVMNRLRGALSSIKDFKPFLQDLSTRGFTAKRGYPVEFTVRGPDWEMLAGLVSTIMEKMRKEADFLDVDTDYQLGQPEIRITPLREAAYEHHVSMEEIGTTVRAMIGGVKAGKFLEGGHRNDIRVRLNADSRTGPADIEKLMVRNQHGELVKLEDVVKIEQVATLKSITREDRERAIGVFANIGKGSSQDRALKKVEQIAKEVLPEGYRLVFSGSAQTFKESFSSLTFALWMGIIVAYMVLATQYDSFVHPFTVLLALPFALSGAWLALALFGSSLNIFSFIGIILLMGIAKKNSILLVDFTNRIRQEGKDVTTALLTACPQRLRPILMTSFATIAAALPPALALGPGSETRVPMAIAILGGISLSTLLTLFVVPCAYSLLSGLENKTRIDTEEHV